MSSRRAHTFRIAVRRSGARHVAAPLVAGLAAAAVAAGCTAGAHSAARTPSGPGPATVTGPPRSVSGTSAAPTGPRSVTILGSGDVLIHPPLWEQAHADALAEGRSGYDFGPMYAGVASDVHAAGADSLATCELETPLAPPGGPFTGWPNFSSPPQVLTALKAVGYRSCTTASNHSIDEGYAGVKRTLDELDAAGLAHTGSARSAAEAAHTLIITLPNGVRVAQLAYAFGFNGIPLPPGQPWLANLTDVPTIVAAAHRARQAGADIVVLSMHWGTEYDHLATQTQRDEATQLLASPDIDVILGDHAHVVQPMQSIHGKWVIYCMGNQISRHADPIEDSREGVMPEFTFTEVAPHSFRITHVAAIATWMVDSPKLRLIDLADALRDPATSAIDRKNYQHAYDQIAGYLDAYGARRDGLVIKPA